MESTRALQAPALTRAPSVQWLRVLPEAVAGVEDVHGVVLADLEERLGHEAGHGHHEHPEVRGEQGHSDQLNQLDL